MLRPIGRLDAKTVVSIMRPDGRLSAAKSSDQQDSTTAAWWQIGQRLADGSAAVALIMALVSMQVAASYADCHEYYCDHLRDT